MKVEVNRNDEMPKAGDLVIDELGNIGILMHNGYIWLLKHSGKPVDVPTLVSYTDSDNPPIFDGESWNVDPTYDCLECMGAVNDLHPANLFSFPIPEDMTYEDEPIKFEICLK